MRQLVYTMLATSTYASFYLWCKDNLLEHQKVSKCNDHDCSFYLSVLYLVFKNSSISISVFFNKLEFIFATYSSYTAFLTTSLFTTLLCLLKSTGTVFNLSIYILSISAINLAEFDFDVRLEASTLVAIALF